MPYCFDLDHQVQSRHHHHHDDGYQVEVTVINGLIEDNVAIHWHGVHPVEDPWEDGKHQHLVMPVCLEGLM